MKVGSGRTKAAPLFRNVRHYFFAVSGDDLGAVSRAVEGGRRTRSIIYAGLAAVDRFRGVGVRCSARAATVTASLHVVTAVEAIFVAGADGVAVECGIDRLAAEERDGGNCGGKTKQAKARVNQKVSHGRLRLRQADGRYFK